MTENEKQLLLKDICSRLPYGVKLGFENSDLILVPKEFNIYTIQVSTSQIYPKSDSMTIGHIYNVWNYRPYLRSMSSMTEEEVKEFAAIESTDIVAGNTKITCMEITADAIDWLLAHHFDFRGLIDKGLALKAPEEMYKTE